MNWLETVFGLSPDGGNGTTEMVIAISVATGIALGLAMVVAGRTHRARARRAKRRVN